MYVCIYVCILVCVCVPKPPDSIPRKNVKSYFTLVMDFLNIKEYN